MGVIGRNEPCYCGSGKKYKKCCLKDDEEKLRKGMTPTIPFEESLNHARITHDISFGIKELALALLEQIIIWLSSKHVLSFNIQVYSKQLHYLASTEKIVEHYLDLHRGIMSEQGRSNIHWEQKNLRERAKTYPSLTENERTVIRTITKSNLGEFLLLGVAQTADYSAMKILNEFCYQAIIEGIPDDKYIISATLYVDSDEGDKEKLVNWELGYTDADKPSKDIWIEWEALDILNDEYHKYAHSLHELEEDTKNELATAMYQEKTLPHKSKYRVSYRGLVMTYTSILEKELKRLIELKEKRNIPVLTMKHINDYILKNSLPYLDDKLNLYSQLEEIRLIRNGAAHGDEVKYVDFQKVKNFLIDQQILEFISWAKAEYEDKEETIID